MGEVVVESLLGDLELSCPSRGGHSSSAAPSPKARQSAGLLSTTGCLWRVLPCKYSSRPWFFVEQKEEKIFPQVCAGRIDQARFFWET